MWNIRVNVKQENIDNSLERHSHHCMIADAIHDRLPWATFVMVDTQSIRFNNLEEGKRWIYLTPPEAQKALVLFDQGIKVKPFSFTLCQGIVKAVKNRKLDRNKNKRTTEARRRRKATNRKQPKNIPSMHREFGLRKLVR